METDGKKKVVASPVLPSLQEEKAHHVNIDSKNIKISKTPNEGPLVLEQERRVIDLKKPPKKLISCIQKFGNSCDNSKNLREKITEIGIEARFSDHEINLLAREVLRDRLTRSQLNYWFPLKGNWKKKEKESSSHNLQFVKNDSKKDIDKSQVAFIPEPVEGIVTTIPLKSPEEGHQEVSVRSNLSSAPSTAIATDEENTNRIVTIFDSSDPNTIDCTNHPMAHMNETVIEKDDPINDKGKVIYFNDLASHSKFNSKHMDVNEVQVLEFNLTHALDKGLRDAVQEAELDKDRTWMVKIYTKDGFVIKVESKLNCCEKERSPS